MLKKCFYKQILFILLFLLITIRSDIRIANNNLNAQGVWKIKYDRKKIQHINPNIQSSDNQNNIQIIDSYNIQDSMNYQNNKQSKKQQFNSVKKSNLNDQDKQNNKKEINSANQIDKKVQIQQENIQQQFDFQKYLFFQSGQCYLFFYDSNYRDQFENKQIVDTVSIRFHNPKYIDDQVLVFKIHLENYNLNKDSLIKQSASLNYTYFQQLQRLSDGIARVSYQVNNNSVILKFNNNQISIQYHQIKSGFFFPFVLLAYNIIVLYLVLRFEKRQITVERVSLITLYHAVFFFIYLSTFFFIVGMSQLPHPLSMLLICGCFQILISIKLIKKFQLIIQRISNLNGYCSFYCLIFLYVWYLFNYYYSSVFIILNSLFLLPQIIHNIRFGNKLGKQYQFLAILCSNQIYFIYLRGCPENVMKYHPKYYLCFIIILLVSIQIWFILMQNKKGPYFFIRKKWLPNYFQYYQTIKLDSKCNLFEQECPICLCILAEQDPITMNQKLNQQIKNQLKADQIIKTQQNLTQLKEITIMITPCNHKFHAKCLQQWLQYKKECPVDRSEMPALYK